jgi:drug/metabolite transporter (DMT)-like permease
MMNRPLFLLIGTGAMLGLNFPIGKLAIAAGVNPALWAAVISLGAGLAMLAITTMFERGAEKPIAILRFSFISGFLSYVMPNFLTFTVIPKIGSGLAAIMFALSPVVTALLSIILRVHPPNRFGMIGIGLGLIGALIIIFGRNVNIEGGVSVWLLAALLIPVFLGLGNVYRTSAWPKGASPRQLASTTNLAAVPFLLAVTLIQTSGMDLRPLSNIPSLIALQLAISTTMFLMFFRLQQIGGPTYLSQIGYVAAAAGLFIGVFYLGETYPFSVWLGAGVVALGIAFSTLGQLRQP